MPLEINCSQFVLYFHQNTILTVLQSRELYCDICIQYMLAIYRIVFRFSFNQRIVQIKGFERQNENVRIMATYSPRKTVSLINLNQSFLCSLIQSKMLFQCKKIIIGF